MPRAGLSRSRRRDAHLTLTNRDLRHAIARDLLLVARSPMVPSSERRPLEVGEMGAADRSLSKMIRRFLKNDSAIAVTEYGLLVALIAVALIAVVLLFGQNISSWFSSKTSQITTV